MLGNRLELVYVVRYVSHKGQENKWVEIRRMNHKSWEGPLKLKYGYKSLMKAKSKINYPISFSAADIEWFLYYGIESFLLYHEQKVM